ncbi:hypothetical protein JCM8547_001555 [Rhodosporidiobolus lusitaniae]
MFIDGVKFACESCIKGHRQTSCQHSDRPLTQIMRRGRPATACDACREARKISNSHRTCTHKVTDEDGADVSSSVPKVLPHGAKDLLRRSSSTQSRTSTTSTPHSTRKPSSASRSTSVVSEEELATVGRKKSISRAPSSRRSSSAAQKGKHVKPHDLAHGHYADHPMHISSAYSPYPHHEPKAAKEKAIKTEPATPAPDPERKMTNEELASAFFFRGFPAAAPDACPTPPPLLPKPKRTSSVPLTTPAPEPPVALPLPPPPPLQPEPVLAPLPSLPPISSASPNSTYPTFYTPSPPGATYSTPSGGFLSSILDTSTSQPAALPASLPLPAAFSAESDPYANNPAMEAFVLGPMNDRPLVTRAPALGDEMDFYSEPEQFSLSNTSVPGSTAPFYSFATPAAASTSGPSPEHQHPFLTTENFPLASTSSTPAVDPSSAVSNSFFSPSDSGILPPPNPAVYGYPLHPVDSHTSYASYTSFSSSTHAQSSLNSGAASLSGYESAASGTGGAASALERLDLDFDPFSGGGGAGGSAYVSSSASSAFNGLGGVGQQPQPSSGLNSSAEEEAMSQTDLDGILSWLASSASAGVFPPSSSSSTPGSVFPPPPPAPPPSVASDRPPPPPSLSSFSSFSGPIPSQSHPDSTSNSHSGFASSASSLHNHRPISPSFPTSTFFNAAPSYRPPQPSSLSFVEPLAPLPDPEEEAVDPEGYEEDDEGEAEELAREAAAGGGGGTVRRRKKGRDPGLELFRSNTITCFNGVGVGDEEDEEEEEEEEGVKSGEEEEDEEDGSEQEEDDAEERFKRGAFARHFGLSRGDSWDDGAAGLSLEEEDLDTFGIDEDWLARKGTQEVHFDFDDRGGASSSSSSGAAVGRVEVKEEEEEDETRVKQEEEEEQRRADTGMQWWS